MSLIMKATIPGTHGSMKMIKGIETERQKSILFVSERGKMRLKRES